MKTTSRSIFILSSLILLASLLFACSKSALITSAPDGATASAVTAIPQIPTLAPLIKQIRPAVVSIAVRGTVPNRLNPLLQDPFFQQFFNPSRRAPQREFQASGSGVVVDAGKGFLLTNHHVIENAEDIKVKLSDGRELTASVIGTDPETDIALLQIAADNLHALPIADSDQLQVGDFVIAVGNPFGLNQSVTSGVVSALGRSGLGIHGYEDFIQTDASINPGNSGGPLLNLRGEIVGINSAIIGPSGGNIGIGFAVPSNMTRSVMSQLVAHGEVQRGQIGVQIQDVTPQLAQSMHLNTQSGALVAAVVNGSPAQAAGLKRGDVVVAVDGRTIRNASDLHNRIGLAPIDKPVQLDILRNGEHTLLQVWLEQRQARQQTSFDDATAA